MLLKRYAAIYPVIGIMGPRQSGKTTLARQVFNHLPYVSFENLDTRIYAKEDPRGFLANYKEGAIFDEVQEVPQLFSYLQEIVDSTDRTGLYILIGSQNFNVAQTITQTLAGRIGLLHLLPLSLSELQKPLDDINTTIFQGGYPRLYKVDMQPVEFYPSYIQTYVERDIRQLRSIENASRFRNFLKLCAARVGQVINLSNLAQDAGISHVTAKDWLSLLEASYLIFLLQPFYKNFSKRLIKMPKLYFYDTGLASSLLGLEASSQLKTHYLRGALFENLVILELLKKRLNQGLMPNLYFWRDHTGHEVDLLGDWREKIYPIEIKLHETPQRELLRNVRYFCKLSNVEKGYLVHTGQKSGMYHAIELVPLHQLNEVFEK